MKSNILFVGLDYDYVKELAKKISDGFEMFFLDVNDLIEYSLINSENVEKVCGIEYLKKERHKVALSTINYENTVINMPYSLFLENDMSNKLSKNALVVYIKLPKRILNSINKKTSGKLNIEYIAFEEFDKLISKKSEIIAKCKSENIDENLSFVLDALKGNLL